MIGVDDWAIRRGQTYGTLTCDLERKCPIAMLDSRSAESLPEWLKAHHEVEVISRDRAGEYAKAAAAESLSKLERGSPSLNGLTSLSDAAVESLIKVEGRVFLSSLTSLSDAAAASLARRYGQDLGLSENALAKVQAAREVTKVLVSWTAYHRHHVEVCGLFITTFGELDRCEGKTYDYYFNEDPLTLDLAETLQVRSTDPSLISKLEEVFGHNIVGDNLIELWKENENENEELEDEDDDEDDDGGVGTEVA